MQTEIVMPTAKPKPPSSRDVREGAVIKPLLKYAGAKNWCAPTLAPIYRAFLESTQGYFVEPFMGSGSLCLATQPLRGVVGDAMEELMEFHTIVRDSPGELAWAVSGLSMPDTRLGTGIDKESYLRVRDMRPDNPLGRAARFFYLARLGFNGLIRHNKSGDNNVPYGDAVYRKSVVGRSARDAIESLFPNREKIEHVSQVLRKLELYTGDFAPLVEAAQSGDLILVDPPYDGTFSGYAANGFDEADQERLAVACVEATMRGAVVVAHNSLTEHTKYLYSEWCDVILVDEKRSIAANGSRRESAPCIVAVSNNAPEGFAEVVRAALGDRVVTT